MDLREYTGLETLVDVEIISELPTTELEKGGPGLQLPNKSLIFPPLDGTTSFTKAVKTDGSEATVCP